MFTEIPEYPEYLISKCGRVWSSKVNKEKGIFELQKGYKYFTVTYNGKNTTVLLHRALARVYGDLPSLASELDVDHIDNDVRNNNLSNLQVLTRKQHNHKTHGKPNKEVLCTSCDKVLQKKTISGKCRGCDLVKQDITREQIEYWVSNYSWARASRELGMSDNGLRKRYTKLSGNSFKDLKKFL